jgi:hypothetical protein
MPTTTEAQAELIAIDIQSRPSITIDWNTILTIVMDLIEAAVVCAPLLVAEGETGKEFIDANFSDSGQPDQWLVDRYRNRARKSARRHHVTMCDGELDVFSVCTLTRMHSMTDDEIESVIEECSP